MDFDFQSLSQEEFEEDMMKKNMITHSTFISGVENKKPKNSFESFIVEERSVSESPYNLFSDTNSVFQAPIEKYR